jgi:hypothetical protein
MNHDLAVLDALAAFDAVRKPLALIGSDQNVLDVVLPGPFGQSLDCPFPSPTG